jgi:hypothetical protein
MSTRLAAMSKAANANPPAAETETVGSVVQILAGTPVDQASARAGPR